VKFVTYEIVQKLKYSLELGILFRMKLFLKFVA